MLRRNGTDELTLRQFERDYDFPFDVRTTEVESIDGTLRTDTSFYKHGLTLKYATYHKQDFDTLLTFLKLALAGNETLEFQFEKIPEYSSWVECRVSIKNPVKFRGGSGTTDYFYSFDLVIREVNSR